MTIYRVDGLPGPLASAPVGEPVGERADEASSPDAHVAEPEAPAPVAAAETALEAPDNAVPILDEKKLPEPVEPKLTPTPAQRPVATRKKTRPKPLFSEQTPRPDPAQRAQAPSPPPRTGSGLEQAAGQTTSPAREASQHVGLGPGEGVGNGPGQEKGDGSGQGAGRGPGQGVGIGQGPGSGQGGALPGLAAPDIPPMLTRRQEPPFPAKARQLGLSGKVTVRLLVNVAGQVERLHIVAAAPAGLFEDVVKATVPHWRFRPARKDGTPVPAWVVAPIRFDLRERD